MAYLDLRLEEKCLQLRDMLIAWLSKTRLSYGDVYFVKQDGEFRSASPEEIRRLSDCYYEELRIERRPIAVHGQGDRKLIVEIQSAGSSLIKELKAVMSY
jgi:hypothetical protein